MMSKMTLAHVMCVAIILILHINSVDGFRPGASASRLSPILRPLSLFRAKAPCISARYRELGRCPISMRAQLLGGTSPPPAVVGDVMVGEIVEIGGTVNDPRVRVKLFGLNGDVFASLRTNDLSSSELSNIVIGNVAEMRVINVDSATGSVEVAFPAPIKSPRVTASPSYQKSSPLVQDTPGFIPVKQTAKLHPPANAVLLNSLKCGMKLEGTVQSCTLYAAFVMANVYRQATGGTWREVNGMLHTSDIIQPHRLLPKRMGLNAAPSVARAKLGQMSIEAGTKLTVYVKDVFPNSGRFTLTTDPDMSKSKLALIHRQKKEEATTRKQSRRLRRLFETLKEGDVVSGTVHSIVPEGVLINVDGMKGMVSSPSAFAMKGIIKQKDLPTQFEVPGPLSSAICVEMLRQDFYPGRRLQCSVLGINPKVDPRQQYQLILLYESFGPEDGDSPGGFFKSPAEEEGDNLESSTSGLNSKAGNQLKRGDGDDWGDYGDSNNSDGDEDAFDFESTDAIDKGRKGRIDGMDDEEVEAMDFNPVVPKPTPKNSPKSAKIGNDGNRPVQPGATLRMHEKKKPEIPQGSTSTPSMEKSDSRSVRASDGSVSNRHKELFAELCDKNGFVTCKRLKESEYVNLMVQSGQLTIDHVNKIILSCIGTKKTGISLDEFANVMTRMEDTIRALSSRNRIKSTVSAIALNETDDGQRRRGGPGGYLFDDPEILEDAEITFDLLRGSDEYLTVAKLKEWKYLKDMMKSKGNKDGKLTPTDVENAILLAYSDKFAANTARIPAPSRTSGQLNKDQFLIFLEAVDKFLNGIEIKLRDYYGNDDMNDADEDVETSGSTKASKALPNQPKLKPAASAASKSTNKSSINGKNAGNSKNPNVLLSNSEDVGEDFDEEDMEAMAAEYEEGGEAGGDEDEYFDEEDEEFDGEAAAESLYDLLRGPQATLTVKSLCEWDFIQLLVKSGQLQPDALTRMVKAAVGNSSPSTPVPIDKFKLFMEEVNVIAENMEDIEADDS